MSIDPRRILFQDEHLLVVNKLAGELVVAASGEGKMPLFDFLKKDIPGLRVLHRLDYQTSGIIVFAKSAAVVAHVRETKFAGWKKTYVALVAGHIAQASGTINRPLKARTQQVMVDAVTHYKVLRQFGDAAYVEAVIDTGRKHQIRQHFAAIGHPLLRDPLYGNARADELFAKRYGYSRFFLHSIRLSLPHPVTGEELHIVAPLPASFSQVLEKLAVTPSHAVSKAVPASKRRIRPRTRNAKKALNDKKKPFVKQEWKTHGRRNRRR